MLCSEMGLRETEINKLEHTENTDAIIITAERQVSDIQKLFKLFKVFKVI